jgi:hypothetical protein
MKNVILIAAYLPLIPLPVLALPDNQQQERQGRLTEKKVLIIIALRILQEFKFQVI